MDCFLDFKILGEKNKLFDTIVRVLYFSFFMKVMVTLMDYIILRVCFKTIKKIYIFFIENNNYLLKNYIFNKKCINLHIIEIFFISLPKKRYSLF